MAVPLPTALQEVINQNQQLLLISIAVKRHATLSLCKLEYKANFRVSLFLLYYLCILLLYCALKEFYITQQFNSH